MFLILDHFLPFYPRNNPENQNFEKMKKTPGEFIILQMCTINGNHMMYGLWEMECNRKNFFCHFENQNFEKLKKKIFGDIIFLNLSLCTINGNLMMYIWFLKYGEWQTEFSGYFLPFCPPNSPQNQNFLKMKKMLGVTTIFHTCMITWYTCTLPEIWCTLQWING